MSNVTEALHDCPHCGTKNFTAKGLASHHCAKHAARRDASLAVAGSHAVTPASALATALHLAEMNPEQLAAASRSLLAAEERYDRMSGICATLNGLVLLEARRKIAHGNWIEWVESVAGCSRMHANRKLRIAESFLANLSKSKCNPRVTFETATQLLLEDFTAMLGAEAASPIDESNPVFAAVAAYVDGRSYRALADALPIGRRGGWQGGKKSEKPPEQPMTPEQMRGLLRAQCESLGKQLAFVFKEHCYTALNEAELAGLFNHCETVAEAVKNWQRLPHGERQRQLADRALKLS